MTRTHRGILNGALLALTLSGASAALASEDTGEQAKKSETSQTVAMKSGDKAAATKATRRDTREESNLTRSERFWAHWERQSSFGN